MADGEAAPAGVVRVVGQVCRRRPHSRFVLFLDVASQGPEGGVCAVALRADTLRMGEAELSRIKHDVKCGDEVAVEGYPAATPAQRPTPGGPPAGLRAVALEVLRPWRDVSAEAYRRPPPPAAASAVAADNADAELCKAWIATGSCDRQGCPYRHTPRPGQTVGAARYEWVQQRRRQRQALPTIAGEEDVAPEQKRPRRQRAVVFCDWVAATFPPHVLRRGVVDVAGGRGELAFELAVVRQIRTLVVDPRPVRLSRWQHRYITNNGIPSVCCQENASSPPLQSDSRTQTSVTDGPARDIDPQAHHQPVTDEGTETPTKGREEDFCHSESEAEEDSSDVNATVEGSPGLTAGRVLPQLRVTLEA
eukprot:EG_transcript_17320